MTTADALVVLGDRVLLFALLFGAVGLTFAMFHSRSAMLGFPSAILWALVGGYAYTLSTAAWDFFFLLAFACLLGMTTFSMLGAYGLREKRDSLADEEFEKGESKHYIDETGKNSEPKDKNWYEDDGIPDTETQSAGRTAQRRTSRKRRGEFDF